VRPSLAIAVLVAVAGSVLLAGAATPASAAPLTLIDGSGSSWASNSLNQWIADVEPDGLEVVYTPDGSTAGKKDFANLTSDYAVTDVPYLGYDPVTGTTDSSAGREYGDIPVVAGATTFAYHLKIHGKLVRSVRLSGLTLAKIFTNQITNWDDPAITAENNGVRLPSLKIIPVVHSDGSGVTYDFTTYLADRYPRIWKAFAGTTQPTQYYPASKGQISQNGSDSVMNYISSSAADGAIGAVEYAYALGANYPVVNLENQAGYFVPPSPYDVAIALRNATIDENPADADYMRPNLEPVFASTDRRAYPLSSYASMLVPTSATDSGMTTAKRQTLADFAYYAMCQGQRTAALLGYAPLPLNLVKAGFTQIDRLGAADPLVDLTELTVSTCGNPTFIDDYPNRDHLGSIAPEPPPCEKAGQGPCGVETLALLTASKSVVRAGHAVVFHGRLVDELEVGDPPHAAVHLQRRLRHHAWKTIRVMKTSATGVLTARLRPASTADYRLVDAEPGSGHPVSAVVRVKVT
jgi:phosphate transport system substrate-binding protein